MKVQNRITATRFGTNLSNTDTLSSYLKLNPVIRIQQSINEYTIFLAHTQVHSFDSMVGSSDILHIFPITQCGHVNDPPALTILSSLQQLAFHISHERRIECNSEHIEYSLCDFVHLCVLELFTDSDWSDCKL